MTTTESRTTFVSIGDAATHMGCSDRTIRRLIAAGSLTGYRLGPRLVRIDLDELDALLQPIPTAGRAFGGGDDAV